jgi:hypothetical protein
MAFSLWDIVNCGCPSAACPITFCVTACYAPAVGASVVVKAGTTTVASGTTASDGCWPASIAAATYTVVVSLAGYQTQTQTVAVRCNHTYSFCLLPPVSSVSCVVDYSDLCPHSSITPFAGLVPTYYDDVSQAFQPGTTGFNMPTGPGYVIAAPVTFGDFNDCMPTGYDCPCAASLMFTLYGVLQCAAPDGDGPFSLGAYYYGPASGCPADSDLNLNLVFPSGPVDSVNQCDPVSLVSGSSATPLNRCNSGGLFLGITFTWSG